jgi:hypothetical protein
MLKLAIGLKGQAKPEGWGPTKAVRLTALLGTLILLSIALNAMTIAADSKLRQRASVTGICPVIIENVTTENANRLAC